MAKFKKLALLCLSLLTTATIACADSTASSTNEVVSSETSSALTSDELDTSESLSASDAPEEDEQIYLSQGDNTVEVAAGMTVTPIFNVSGAIFGEEYSLSWTSENAIVTVNGIPVDGMQTNVVYTPILQLTISTANGKAENIVITVSKVEPAPSPIATLGDNTITLSAEQAMRGIDCLFTAKETATYTIAITTENGFISWETDDGYKGGFATAETSSSFLLEVGESVTIHLSTTDNQAGSVTFILTQSNVYNPYALTTGINNLTVTENNGEAGVTYTFTSDTDGYYALNSRACDDNTSVAISYVINGETKWVDDGQTLLFIQSGGVIHFTVYVYNSNFYQEGVYILPLEITPVAVSNLPYTISLTNGEASFYFYADHVGEYTFDLSKGATLWVYSTEVWEFISVESFVVEKANSLVTLIVKSNLSTKVTITILEKR
jgi:hypothetical protein